MSELSEELDCQMWLMINWIAALVVLGLMWPEYQVFAMLFVPVLAVLAMLCGLGSDVVE